MDYDHSWEVIAIELHDETEFEDCRAISEIGYRAPVLRTRKVDSAASMIDSGLSRYHIDLDGRQVQLKAAKDEYLYVRTLDEDSSDDPLLSLPTVTEYITEEKFQR